MARKNDVQSELQIRGGVSKATRSQVRNILSSKEQLRSGARNTAATQQLGEQNQLQTKQQSKEQLRSPSSRRQQRKPAQQSQTKTASDTLGANGWRITVNDDQRAMQMLLKKQSQPLHSNQQKPSAASA